MKYSTFCIPCLLTPLLVPSKKIKRRRGKEDGQRENAGVNACGLLRNLSAS